METAKRALDHYIQLMDSQRQELYTQLGGIPAELVWKRPEAGAWSIGENLDHLRVIYESFLSLFNFAWVILQPWAKLTRNRPCILEIDNVYRRPGFPQKVGWIWPPKYKPENPLPLDTLRNNLEKTHARVAEFYLSKDSDLLAHTPLYDPAIGSLNLIQALRVGVYHDSMHAEQILATYRQVKEL